MSRFLGPVEVGEEFQCLGGWDRKVVRVENKISKYTNIRYSMIYFVSRRTGEDVWNSHLHSENFRFFIGRVVKKIGEKSLVNQD